VHEIIENKISHPLVRDDEASERGAWIATRAASRDERAMVTTDRATSRRSSAAAARRVRRASKSTVMVAVMLVLVLVTTTTLVMTTVAAADDRGGGDVETPDAIDEAFMAWYDARAAVGDETARTPPPVYANTAARGRDDATRGIDARRQRGLFGSTAAREKGEESKSRKRGGVGDDDVLPKFRIRDALTASSPTRALGKENDEWALALELAKERAKGKASRYSPFVESLYEHTPAASTRVPKKASVLLRGHAAAATLKRYQDDAIEGWKKSEKIFKKFPTIFSSDDITREAFEEALAIVRATALAATSDEGVVRALVPMAHLVPHDTRSAVPCVKIVNDTFVVNVDEFNEGEELVCSHGNFSDAETFARFGAAALYSAEKNSNDKIVYRFAEEEHGEKDFSQCGSPGETGFRERGATKALLCKLRLAAANATEWRAVKNSVHALRTKPLSEESEIAVYEALFTTLIDLLNSYPSSDTEDEDLLARRESLSRDERLAVAIRLREKRLALSSLNHLQHTGRKQFGGKLFDAHFASALPTPFSVGKDEL